MPNQQTLSLGALIAAAIDARLVDVHTHLPATIETYDAATQSCSVQVELRAAFFDELGDRVPARLPVINNVPVAFARGGGFRTTYPLKRGDRVWLEFCEASLDRWKPRGGDTDPGVDRRFNLSDAVAVTGVADFGHPLASAPTDRMSIGSDTGASIEITDDEVRVGGNSGLERTWKADTFLSTFDTLIAAIATAVGGIPTGGAAAGSAITGALNTFDTAIVSAKTSIAKVK